MKDVEIAILERQFNPFATAVMTFGDGEASFGCVMGDVDVTACRTTCLERLAEILQTTDNRALWYNRRQIDLRPYMPAVRIAEGPQ